jgi:hypothetical protein
VPPRFPIIAAALTCALVAPAAAAAAFRSYPWPLRPFHQEHPIRANFGDPRTRFAAPLFDGGIEGPGAFSFHNGIDIAAPDGTAVYPVTSGTAKLINNDAAVSVSTGKGRVFEYEHIVPSIRDGQRVVASKTVIGHIARTFGHVHLTEIREGHVWNPLAAGGIAPYHDTLKPRVAYIQFRPPASPFREVEPLGVCGTVAIVADVFDTPQLRVSGTFAGFPVGPALVAWSIRRFGGAVVKPEVSAADFRTTLPPVASFWDVYARGTYQNAPRFANRQFNLMPGRFIFQLASALDTRTVPNGVYIVSVRAVDVGGNATTASQRFTIANDPASETGCSGRPPQGP